MKFASIAISSLGSLLILYTMICGFWIHSHGATPEEIAHHSRFAVSGVVILLVGTGLLVYKMLKG